MMSPGFWTGPPVRTGPGPMFHCAWSLPEPKSFPFARIKARPRSRRRSPLDVAGIAQWLPVPDRFGNGEGVCGSEFVREPQVRPFFDFGDGDLEHTKFVEF